LISWMGWFGLSVVTGWSSVMVAVTLLGSVQLLVLGIFGEYLGRMYEQSKCRPLFVIERIIRSGNPQDEPDAPDDSRGHGSYRGLARSHERP
jgi:polyisoprenyl-phosphate glycosyltransferase